ncbi:glycosyltransferase family 2 protein [Bacteriovorax sp. Seq25_V]|uniref:glycosyltransferase family 2 protein n=1 Tax=Bacteriovorax sp. Seq25_V TaxID=1201288 RepID=UPI00038A2CEC|nr:glycosyltransferase family 2 protein [Bacteriovorax sp. Seq25_V]EQC46813.1 glycosyltransferase, group 2 family protein [Bacteriovorax sp. Seq25_V]
MKISIVTPCYNEAANIPELINRFSKVSKKLNLELVIVNNGSTDNTVSVLTDHAKPHDFIKVVDIPVNKGYGFGITEGLKQCTGDFIGWTHADLQTDPMDIYRAYQILLESETLQVYIKGRRSGRPLLDTILSIGMSIFETLLFQKKIYEINAQPNIFPAYFFKAMKNYPNDFSLDLFFYTEAIKKDLKIIRMKTLFPSRLHGASKWNKGPMSVVKFITRVVVFSIKRRFTY